MMIVVLIGGLACLVAGLVTVGLGVELDLSFGNTLILAGVIVACTGVLIMLGLWIVVRELKEIARQLGPGCRRWLRRQARGHRRDWALRWAIRRRTMAGCVRPRSAGAGTCRHRRLQSPAPPWLDEARFARAAARRRRKPPPAAKPRRNLLFSSSSRKERERAQARTRRTIRHRSAFDTAGSASSAMEPADRDAASATFDDAWPKSERLRGGEAPMPRRSGRAPSTFAERAAGVGDADRVAPVARSEDQPPVTVLKSGVVDGMAYSLYSDGSIEAQMPEGMMRFASIDELRAHLDQRP